MARQESPSLEGVFVLGCPRSGTSALAWALAQHPRFWTSDESDFIWHLFGDGKLEDAYKRSQSGLRGGGWLQTEGVSYEEFYGFLGSGISALFASRSGGRIWVDQSPSYLLMAKDLALMFPSARFLHVARDGRQVVASMLASGFDEPWAHDPTLAWETWVAFVKAGLELEEMYSGRVMRVLQQRMREEPRELMAEVLSFLGCEYHDGPASFLMNKTINSSFSRPDQEANAPTPRAPEPPESLAQEVERLTALLGSPVARVPLSRGAGSQEAGGGEKPLILRTIRPSRTQMGVPFNVQPNGMSALSLVTENATEKTQVIMDGVQLATTFGHPGWLTAVVPDALFSQPGKLEVFLKDGERESNHMVFYVNP